MQIDEIIHIPVSSARMFEYKIDWINKRAKQQKIGLRIDLTHLGEEARLISVTRRFFVDGAYRTTTGEESRPSATARPGRSRRTRTIPGRAIVGWRRRSSTGRSTIAA